MRESGPESSAASGRRVRRRCRRRGPGHCRDLRGRDGGGSRGLHRGHCRPRRRRLRRARAALAGNVHRTRDREERCHAESRKHPPRRGGGMPPLGAWSSRGSGRRDRRGGFVWCRGSGRFGSWRSAGGRAPRLQARDPLGAVQLVGVVSHRVAVLRSLYEAPGWCARAPPRARESSSGPGCSRRPRAVPRP